MLLAVLIFWRRRWARKLLLLTLVLIMRCTASLVNYALRYPLESRYPPLLDPGLVSYDAIVVLTSSMIPPEGLIPFSTIDEHMFRRLDEAWRLYRIQPKPIILSGGHVNPFTPDKDENRIGREYLIRWGVPKHHVIGEGKSRDTFESAAEVQKLFKRAGLEALLAGYISLAYAPQHAGIQSKSPRTGSGAGRLLARQIATLRHWIFSRAKAPLAASTQPCTSISALRIITGGFIMARNFAAHLAGARAAK